MESFDNNYSLQRLSALLELSFTHICVATFDHHLTTTFPVDILLVILTDDGQGDSFMGIPSQHLRYPLLAGHVYFVPCELEVRFDITPGITTLAFHFNLTFLHGLDVFAGSQRTLMRHDPELVARLHALFNEDKDEIRAICALKMEVMRCCLACWPDGLERLMSALRKHEPILRHIHEQGNAELTVGALAALAGQRQDVFSRAFSRDVGRPPQEIIHADLLKKIAARLLMPEVSVKQVADEMKFSSEFYMSRFFKNRTGLSPSEYQRQFRK